MEKLFFLLLLALVAASACFYLAAILCAARFFRERSARIGIYSNFTPPVSLLKPVRGVDSRAYDCFASFCRQDYPDYEIVFGVRDSGDPAVALIERLQRDFPERRIKLVIDARTIGASGKVSNLHNCLAAAQHDIVVLSDSDIIVGTAYLREVVAPLTDEQIGLVTCLYRAIGGANFSSLMEAFGISAEFALGVVVARYLEGVRFALGSTIVIRKRVLAAFGGFPAIADYLADDYLLGYLTAQSGYRVALSHYIVETVMPRYTISSMLQHQLRWARTTRYSRPGGYRGLLFTFTTPFALLLLICFPASSVAWAAAASALLIRGAAALYVGVLGLGDRSLLRHFYLLPVRDLLSFVIWLASFLGNTVQWRGDRFRLAEGGRLVPMKEKN